MIRHLAIAIFAILAAAGSYASPISPVKVKVGDCAVGASAGVVPGQSFTCSVTGEPEKARITVYGYSEAIDVTAAQTITGNGALAFRVAKSAAPGRHIIALIAIDAEKNTVDSASEMAVTVGNASAVPQPTEEPPVSIQRPVPNSPPISHTDSPGGYMDDRRRYIPQ